MDLLRPSHKCAATARKFVVVNKLNMARLRWCLISVNKLCLCDKWMDFARAARLQLEKETGKKMITGRNVKLLKKIDK